MPENGKQRAEKPAITNTAEQLKKHAPALILANLATNCLGGPGGFIEQMEAAGQRELAGQSSQLPSAGLLWHRMSGHGKPELEEWKAAPEERKAFEAMGIKVLGEVDGDPIWCRVELPAGWRIEPTEHSMWSHLLDAKGRTRARIFYKAAFYDRSCHIDPDRRYRDSYGPNDEGYDKPSPRKRQCAVYDAGITKAEAEKLGLPFDEQRGAVVYATKLYAETDNEQDRAWSEKAMSLAEKDASDWLKRNYPEYKDPAAYWETE